jgi:hypothetical protein
VARVPQAPGTGKASDSAAHDHDGCHASPPSETRASYAQRALTESE